MSIIHGTPNANPTGRAADAIDKPLDTNAMDLICARFVGLVCRDTGTTDPLRWAIQQIPSGDLDKASLNIFLQTYLVLYPADPSLAYQRLFEACLKAGHYELAAQLVEHGLFRDVEPLFTLCLKYKQEALALNLICMANWLGDPEQMGKIFAAAFNAECYELIQDLLDMQFQGGMPREEIEAMLAEVLRHACVHGDLKLVNTLLSFRNFKPTLDALDQDGLSALHLAVLKGRHQIAEALLNAGASVDVKDTECYTPLHLAALLGQLDTVKMLLERFRADPNLRNHEGNSALHQLGFGLREKHFDQATYNKILKLLMKHGCNLELENNAGLKARMAATGLHSNTSLERVLGNANGLPDELQSGRNYAGLSTDYPVCDTARIAVRDMPFNPAFTREELTDAIIPEGQLETNPAAIQKRIQDGSLTILHAGWAKHSIYLVFYKGYMVICNRGERPQGAPVNVAYKIDLNEFAKHPVVVFIAGYRTKSAEKAQRFYYTLLPKVLRAKSDLLTKKLEALGNKPQKVGNCRMTIKSALRVGAAFLTLDNFLKQYHLADIPTLFNSQNAHTYDNLADLACKKAYEFSKHWSTFYRLQLLNDYLNDDMRQVHFEIIDTAKSSTATLLPRDPHLVASCWGKLVKRPTMHPHLLDGFPYVKAAASQASGP